MFLIVTRNFPPDIGGIQILMGGLSESLLNHGPVKVFAYEYPNSESYDKKSLMNIDISDTCYACGQIIDNSQSRQLHNDLDNDLCNTKFKIKGLLEEREYAKERVDKYQYDSG